MMCDARWNPNSSQPTLSGAQQARTGRASRTARSSRGWARAFRLRGALAYAIAVLALLTGPLVASAQETVAKITFSPASIHSGQISQLTITLGNTNANGAAAVLTATLTDTLPAGLAIANPNGIGGSCTGAAIAATAGGSTVSYAAGATVPAGGCTIQVNVTATTTRSTTFNDVIAAGALQTTLGSNAAGANGTLVARAVTVVPNLTGLSQAEAANALQSAGLILGTVTKGATTTTPYNAVASQSVPPGKSVDAGTIVSIKVSTGAGLATNANEPLTSVPGFVAPYQLSEAAALERVCAALQSADPSTLSVGQRNLLANCLAILGTNGGGVNAGGLKNTLDALSGNQTTAQQRTGVQFAGAQFTNIGARLAQLREGVNGASFAGLDPGLPAGNGVSQLLTQLAEDLGIKNPLGSTGGGAGDPDTGLASESPWGLFVNGSLRRGSQDTTTFETPFDFRSNTVTAGVDYRASSRLVAGLALSHSNGTTTFTDGSGRLDAKNNSVSLYGTFYDKDLYVDVIGTYGHINYDATRSTSFGISTATVDVPTNCSGGECSVNTTGATSAKQLAFSTNVGYGFTYEGLVWGPDIAIDYTHVHVGGFTENDPAVSGLGLTFGDDVGESLLGKAGGHLSYALKTTWGVLLPEIRAHYVHEFKNEQRALSVRFSDDPYAGTATGAVSNFVVFTDPPDRNYFDWAAGVSAQFAYGISGFVDYNAIESSEQRVHEFAFGVRIEYPIR